MNTHYQSKDFYLSSYLIANGFPLLGVTKSAGLTIFEFENSTKLTNSIAEYYGFTASVNPISFGNAMRALKSIIHADTNGTEQYHTTTRKVS